MVEGIVLVGVAYLLLIHLRPGNYRVTMENRVARWLAFLLIVGFLTWELLG